MDLQYVSEVLHVDTLEGYYAERFVLGENTRNDV